MHPRFVSSLVLAGLLTIPLAGRETVRTGHLPSSTAPSQAATGLAAAPDPWFRAGGVTLRYREAGSGSCTRRWVR